MKSKNKKDQMSLETAFAFAVHAYQQLHPRSEWPEWWSRYTAMGMQKLPDTNELLVTFTVTSIKTRCGIPYFEVRVNSKTGETKVMLDLPLSSFNLAELASYK